MPIELISGLELDGIREDTEQIYTGECMIQRRNPVIPDDVAADGSLNVTRSTLYTDIPCTLAPIMSRRDRFDEFGQALIFTRQYRIRVHWSIENLRIRDLVTITAADDPAALDRLFEIRDVILSDDNSTRILTVQDSEE
jgi:hypothetical protein